MLISLHKQATTTPKIRATIQASNEPAWRVAERYGISEQTVWKWRGRDDVHDRSHTPHRLQTTLTPAQEAVAVALRKALLLPLDDLLAVVREFLNPHVSRSGRDRCLRRHGVGNLRALKPKEPKPAHGTFKACEPGYLHIDIKYLPQMADEERRRYLFVAIDRAPLLRDKQGEICIASPDNVPEGSCRCLSQLFPEIFALVATRCGRFPMTPVA